MAGRMRRNGKAEQQPGSGVGPARPDSTELGEPKAARRISVIGATGSGKSVLARRLSNEWRLPLYELDTFFWNGEGRARPEGEFVKAVSELTQRDAWVLDGHYRLVREKIWRRSNMIVWLNYPLWLVGFRLLRRYAQKRHEASRRKAAGAVNGKQSLGGSAQASASWRDRLGRLARTLRERSEYGRVLQAPEYRDAEVVELRSLRATEDLIRSAGRRSARPGEQSGGIQEVFAKRR